MGRKVSPISLRTGIIKPWRSRWFAKSKKEYREFLIQDIKIRNFINKKLRQTAIAKVDIERSPRTIDLTIYTSRPGIIIGRRGGGIEELKKEIEKMIPPRLKVNITIQEVKSPEADASLLAFFITEQIEKRIPYRRIMKQAIDRARQLPEVKGVKVMVSGRLDGVEIARSEWLSSGKLPLHTLRSNIDFAQREAYTTYGVIGIKVWIYKGEVFENVKFKKSRKSLNL